MKVNEIFYSLQGEGCYSGTPAVFIRLSGCNLRCPFCDTQHESGTEMSEAEIVEVLKQWPTRFVVLTGGEPLLQITEKFLYELRHYFVAVETNGTQPLIEGLDWITLSPKDEWLGERARPVLDWTDELKVLYDGANDPSRYDYIRAECRSLQPIDTGNMKLNAIIRQKAVDYCLQHPEWSLSLQIHKILKIR